MQQENLKNGGKTACWRYLSFCRVDWLFKWVKLSYSFFSMGKEIGCNYPILLYLAKIDQYFEKLGVPVGRSALKKNRKKMTKRLGSFDIKPRIR
jgi:hypothetical protein